MALDLIGPIDYLSKKHQVLTIIDHCTKWAEFAILQNAAADDIADAFIVTWAQRYGVP